MSKLNNALNDVQCKNAKPKDKDYKLSDGGGLYLLVKSTGSKYWRMNYRFNGKAKTLAIGVYPVITLSKARDEKEKAKVRLSDGIDPCEYKKASKKDEDPDSFEHVAREWHTKFKANWSTDYADRVLTGLGNDVFPWIGKKPVKDVSAPELLSVLRRIESRGAIDAAHRIQQICGRVFRYAVATGRAERDPSGDLKGAIPPAKEKHYSSIKDPKKIGDLLRAIDDYQGHFVSKCALRLAPLVFVRPGELRHAEWSEIDLDKAEWRIPGEKMKKGQLHIVPLSSQALAILEEIRPLTGSGKYVFPSVRTNSRPISENTLNAGLRRLGYTKDEMTGHGFRSMASTLLNEQGWHHDAIERQLAHAEPNAIRAAYNYAEHLPERRKMMQAWADYLDGLKKGGNVVPLRTGISSND